MCNQDLYTLLNFGLSFQFRLSIPSSDATAERGFQEEVHVDRIGNFYGDKEEDKSFESLQS